MEHILAVAVVLVNTALAVVGVVSCRRLSRRVDAICPPPRPPATRYCPPPDILDPFPAEPAVDTAGAWALEREEHGMRVSDDEIAENRRMWQEFEAT